MLGIEHIKFKATNGALDIRQIELLTPQLLVCNVERTPEGDIADARFAAISSDFIQFLDTDGLEIPWEIVLGLGEFLFKGDHIEVENPDDPAVLVRFNEIANNAMNWASTQN